MPSTLFAAITIAWGRREHTICLNRWLIAVCLVCLPLVATGYLGATVYLVWHDQLLATLMNRQSEMQYGYEDRIAALKDALDQATTRGNADRLTLDTAVHDLALKSERLEARAAIVDDLMRRLAPSRGPTGPAPTAMSTPIRPLGESDGASRRPASLKPDGLREDHAEADPADAGEGSMPARSTQQRVANLTRALEHVSTRQIESMTALAAPTLRGVERMTAALAKTGVTFDRRHVASDVGGPFVPLTGAPREFEQSVALLRDAAVQHARLTALVGVVPLRRPLSGPLEVTSTFGPRMDPFFGRPALHTGIDLRQDWGQAVTATAGGRVTIAGADGGYGNLVEIDHGNGLRTRYAHLGTVAVKVDQKVEAGAVVGHVGSTGRATGPHLHYEVRVDGEPVDPARFLRAGADLFPG